MYKKGNQILWHVNIPQKCAVPSLKRIFLHQILWLELSFPGLQTLSDCLSLTILTLPTPCPVPGGCYFKGWFPGFM